MGYQSQIADSCGCDEKAVSRVARAIDSRYQRGFDRDFRCQSRSANMESAAYLADPCRRFEVIQVRPLGRIVLAHCDTQLPKADIRVKDSSLSRGMSDAKQDSVGHPFPLTKPQQGVSVQKQAITHAAFGCFRLAALVRLLYLSP